MVTIVFVFYFQMFASLRSLSTVSNSYILLLFSILLPFFPDVSLNDTTVDDLV